MGIFDFSKNEEPHYDSTNIQVRDLDVGFVFDYDLSSWEVKAIYEYDWGDNYFTREFKIDNGSKIAFLSIEEDDFLELSITTKIKLRDLDVNLPEYLQRNQEPPKTISYNNVTYYLENAAPGYFHDIGKGENWEEFRSWDFEEQGGDNILCIEQWDEMEFEASIGKKIKEIEISNILPSDKLPPRTSVSKPKKKMNFNITKFIILFVIGFFVIKTCSNIMSSGGSYYDSSQSMNTNYEKTAVDQLVRALSDEENFSIILLDMDSRSNGYFHQYKVLVERPDTVLVQETEWTQVPQRFFAANMDNMGMEIVSKKDGKLSKVASPAGYNHYIGNEKYGHWVQRDGNSFWEFYGRYAFMSSMFHMMTRPVYRSYYNDYYGGGYYGRRSYYGPSGSRMYGTQSYTNSSYGKNTTWASKPTSFKSSVRSQVSRSSSSTQSRSYSPGSSYSGSSSRSSSRYSSSSSRSRSGGFGK